MNMPNYTVEQKAAAFDALWQSCGNAPGRLYDWINIPRSKRRHEIEFSRTPRYMFELLAEGEMRCFRDMLHSLAVQCEQEKGQREDA